MSRRRPDDYDEEIREHIEMETRDNVARGMSTAAARLAALRTFGNVGSVRQRLHEGAPSYWLDTVFQDIRQGLRLLRQSPLLSVSIVLTLTLGIGINTGVFTVLNAIMLRARVQKDPDRFAHVAARYSGDVGPTVLDWGVSTADFRAYQSGVQSLENLAGWSIARATIGADDPTTWLIQPVTCNFFSLYGLEQPRMGRLFRPEECKDAGSAPVVMLSEELWRRRFQADPKILGREILLNRHPFTVVGIAPERFSGRLRGPGIWVPYTTQPAFFGGADFFRNDTLPWLTLEGRLKPGQTRASAQAELAVIARQQDRLVPGRDTTIFVTDGSFVQEPSQRAQVFWIAPLILGALTLLLLLACTNVTMLLLSRAAARQREIAVRLALGAGRQRLLRMLLTETLILAGLAGGISAWIAVRVPATITRLIPDMPYYSFSPDFAVFAYLAAITFLAGMVAGLAPAAESLRVNLTSSLKGQEGLLGGRRSGSRNFLVAAQVAMSLVLLVVACLFAHAELSTFRSNPGFETRQVLQFTARVQAPSTALYRELDRRLRQLPGIAAVAFASAPPFSSDEGGGPREEIRLPGQSRGSGLRAATNSVSSQYFEALGIPIVHGRGFRRGELARKDVISPVVISEALARTLWPAQNPIGRVIEDSDSAPLEVIGVARDVKSQRLGVVDGPVLYRIRDPRTYGDAILVRFQGDPAPVQSAIRQTLRDIDRALLPRITTLQSSMDEVLDSFWKMLEIVLFLAAVAIGLALIGIYGVVAFSVSRRRRETGVRVALGATRRDIVVAVMTSHLRPIGFGLAVGLLLSIGGSIALEQVLRATPIGFEIADPVAFLAAAFLLLTTASVAMLGPALRAARVDPLDALRQE